MKSDEYRLERFELIKRKGHLEWLFDERWEEINAISKEINEIDKRIYEIEGK